MAQTFQDAIYSNLQGIETWTSTQAKIARAVENGHNDKLVIVEQLVRANLNIDPTYPVDWADVSAGKMSTVKGAVNWAAILAFLEAVIPLIWPLIAPLIPKT